MDAAFMRPSGVRTALLALLAGALLLASSAAATSVTLKGVSVSSPSTGLQSIGVLGNLFGTGGNAYNVTVHASLVLDGNAVYSTSAGVGEVPSNSTSPFSIALSPQRVPVGGRAGNGSFSGNLIGRYGSYNGIYPRNGTVTGNFPYGNGTYARRGAGNFIANSAALQGIRQEMQVELYLTYQNASGSQVTSNPSYYALPAAPLAANVSGNHSSIVVNSAATGGTGSGSTSNGETLMYVSAAVVVALAAIAAGFYAYRKRRAPRRKAGRAGRAA